MGSSKVAQTGKDVHAFREEYVNHLVKNGLESDPEFVDHWLAANPVDQQAEMLINRDRNFTIDQNQVLGTELFLSIDAQFRPLEYFEGAHDGQQPLDENAFAHATLDLVLLTGPAQITVTDYKTGPTHHDYQALHYALLIFIHFPFVTEVIFQWDFVRGSVDRAPIRFERKYIEDLKQAVRAQHDALRDVQARAANGKLTVNPYAGLCQFCDAACPLRDGLSQLQHGFPPPQTDDDRHRLAGLLYVATCAASKCRELLRPYCDAGGKIWLDDKLVCETVEDSYTAYPMMDVLGVLGQDFEVPPMANDSKESMAEAIKAALSAVGERAEQFNEILKLLLTAARPHDVSAKWDVPLNRLHVSASDLKYWGKAKKRAGMMDALNAIAEPGKGRKTIEVHRVRSEELIKMPKALPTPIEPTLEELQEHLDGYDPGSSGQTENPLLPDPAAAKLSRQTLARVVTEIIKGEEQDTGPEAT